VILELNIGLGMDTAQVGHKVSYITSWLNYRRPLHSCEFGMKVIHPFDNPPLSEITLVVRVAYKATNGLEAFNNLAADLKQECIAVWDIESRTGYLIGPKRLDWGSFDTRKFKRFK
jgi:hypothetical protein